MSSDYERLRLKNIEDNKRILADLGLLNPFKPLPRVIKNKAVSFGANGSLKRKRESTGERPPIKKYVINDGSAKSVTDLDWHPSCEKFNGERRRSQRLQGKDAADVTEISEEVERLLDDEPRVTVSRDRPMIYGHVPGVEIGSTWQMRIEVNQAGIHRPTVAGIHPGPEGAYSIALSGGYEDDIDLGDCFTYTGEGGRDLKGTKANPKNLRTAAQSKDQSLSRGNQALVRSKETGLPVRVLRGYKLHSPFAPDEGYRYDGLYTVEKWWYTTGLAGFGVYKFALQRRSDQPPPPWHFNEELGDKKSDDGQLSSQGDDTNFGSSQFELSTGDPANAVLNASVKVPSAVETSTPLELYVGYPTTGPSTYTTDIRSEPSVKDPRDGSSTDDAAKCKSSSEPVAAQNSTSGDSASGLSSAENNTGEMSTTGDTKAQPPASPRDPAVIATQKSVLLSSTIQDVPDVDSGISSQDSNISSQEPFVKQSSLYVDENMNVK